VEKEIRCGHRHLIKSSIVGGSPDCGLANEVSWPSEIFTAGLRQIIAEADE
jgi:hypothetical protein